MKVKVQSKAHQISLPDLNDNQFDTKVLSGKKHMISFFRFASCPFCNMRLHQLVSRHNELGKDFAIVAIFDASVDNLNLHTNKHQAPFSILADHKNIYYKKYGIEHSVAGMFKGMIFRMPTLIKGMLKGYLPTKIGGSLTTMPADFLVDESGIIQEAYYGTDEGDHLDFERVKSFSLKN